MPKTLNNIEMTEHLDLPAFNAILIEGQELFATGLKALLQAMVPTGTFTICTDLSKAIASLNMMKYEFIICDLAILGERTEKFIAECRKNYPQSYIIAFSSSNELNLINELLKVGINGYLNKEVSIEEFQKALKSVFDGNVYLSSDLNTQIVTRIFKKDQYKLTKRELDVLRSVAAGNTIKVTADKLSISTHTVISHRRNIMAKLDLNSSGKLVKYAYEHHLY